MNIAIIDDMPSDRNFLLNLLSRYCSQFQLAAQTECFESGEAFLKAFEQTYFDIIFLDIYLNGIDGMKTAEKIREKGSECLLIFSTSSQHHAIKSFRVRAFDYLLKPYGYEQFAEVMHLCDQTLRKRAHYIEVKEGREWVKILLRDILYTDYANHYIQIHAKQRVIKSYMSFHEFSQLLLPYPQFLCCYRNCIVNMDEVIQMEEKDFVMQNGERVPIQRANRSKIRQQYADYMFDSLEEK